MSLQRDEVISLIDDILKECEQHLVRAPLEIGRLMMMLSSERAMIQSHWPLTVQEQREVASGPYGVRILDGSDLTGLSGRLARLYTAVSSDAIREDYAD